MVIVIIRSFFGILLFFIFLWENLKWKVEDFEDVFVELYLFYVVECIGLFDLDDSFEGSLELFVGFYLFMLFGDESGDFELSIYRVDLIKCLMLCCNWC